MTNSSTRIVLTGAGGFLGFHARSFFASRGTFPSAIAVGDSFDPVHALNVLEGADRLIHVAGVNRGTDEQVYEGNLLFAKQLAGALSTCQSPPPVLVYANSIQSGNGSAYGDAKHEAGRVLAAAAEAVGSTFVNLPLPNLFGEHGRPFYNSVTATFCSALTNGQVPEVHQDRQLDLLHAQHAAELLAGVTHPDRLSSLAVKLSVGQLLQKLTAMSETYMEGEIPLLTSNFDRDLFNTYRSYLPAHDRVFRLDRHADQRGSFFEVVRAQGSSGQTSFSTTAPGITRGEHFHLRKIERFCVLSGRGRISMRRLFDNEVLAFDVDGDRPVAIDMPTMWTHNILNTGSDVMYTAFWANELFDAEAPDTFPEEV